MLSWSLILFYHAVPSPPTGLHISAATHLRENITALFQWHQPTRDDQTIVDYYRIFIFPEPLSHPTSNLVISPPWNVTIDARTSYRVNIRAGNCVGESTESTENIGKVCTLVRRKTIVV